MCVRTGKKIYKWQGERVSALPSSGRSIISKYHRSHDVYDASCEFVALHTKPLHQTDPLSIRVRMLVIDKLQNQPIYRRVHGTFYLLIYGLLQTVTDITDLNE